MASRTGIFLTVRSEGSILPAELLQRIIAGDHAIPGLRPEDYHLAPGERLNEAATRSWNRLRGVWETFKKIMDQLPEDVYGTSETRERWLTVLFQELGYGRLQTGRAFEIEGKTYPISHRTNEPVAVHLVSFRQDLDRRTPGRAGAARVSPHSLVQEFLNRSEPYLWGIISNGLKLRILRDNVSLTRTAYVEFDIQAMMDGDAYSDFLLLYLLCHQSRVEVSQDESGKPRSPETCWLEKWYNTAVNEGVRALDDLRKGVELAIETLGAGFLAHPANTGLREQLRSGELATLDYYRQVLRQVYRMLFLFVAEDRDLLLLPDSDDQVRDVYSRFYASSRLRKLARRKRGTRHGDLWRQLNLVFGKLYIGCPELGLPALGSFLFKTEATTELNVCELSNVDLLATLRHLCFSTKNNVLQPVNYRNLGSEELGSVYESLLEMHPEIHLEAAKFELNVAAGSERKTTGSYYTPSSLVNCLLDSALEPVIAQAVRGKTSEEQEQAILDLKVCDPACGSGHFLIAAAHRMAKRLAGIRAQEEEPSPTAIQHALRDVIGHCIYGVDINPMSVELCKINLWLEALEPGRPLAFLDHHIQRGNSLLGTTPALLKRGIPDAAFKPIVGDDKAFCTEYKRKNKRERETGQADMFDYEAQPWQHLGNLAAAMLELDNLDDSTLDGLKHKEEAYARHIESTGYLSSRFLHDALCAAFVWKKKRSDNLSYPVTQQILGRIERNPHDCTPWMRDEVIRLAQEYEFFHWHIAFPDVFKPKPDKEIGKEETTGLSGGFDCVLGNPPWEQTELKEKEFFAKRDLEIANSPAARRKKLIANLAVSNLQIFQEYQNTKRFHDGISHMIRGFGLFPFCARGRINVYAIFAELNRSLLSDVGSCGCIVPSGIATDDTTKFFFQNLIDTNSIRSLYDFENRKAIFTGVHRSQKFCLLTMGHGYNAADFVYFAQDTLDLNELGRHFSLTPADIAILNPNTRTCPIFRSKRDAELTKLIYSRVPVLINEGSPKENPWGIRIRRIFNMGLAEISRLAQTIDPLEPLEKRGPQMGKFIRRGDAYFVPMLEGKMFQAFNHRAAGVVFNEANIQRGAQAVDSSIEDLTNPFYSPNPLYWFPREELDGTDSTCFSGRWLLGFKDVSSPTNERSMVASILPFAASNFSIRVVQFLERPNPINGGLILSCFNSITFDYLLRQSLGGLHISDFITHQLPVLPPSIYDQYSPWSNSGQILSEWLLPRVLELTYTAWDLEPFSQDCGFTGLPFIWDESRRFEIRCELDAAFFHLYLGSEQEWHDQGSPELLEYFPTPRHAVDYIMETFPIVKRKDEKKYGEYRTKRRILELYDQMAECMAGGTEFKSALNPPPGPPVDKEGNFIPMSQWDPDNWPSHIHLPKEDT
jgi:Eco57I restriction-modification methylase